MDLLVVGASVRSVAGSLLRIGCRPIAFDLFADVDLAAVCPATRVDLASYPDCLASAVEHLPPLPWLYTGAIENHPDVVASLSRRFRLLGNDAATLRAVRDPTALARVVEAAGLAMPATRLNSTGLPRDGSWLCKPVRSGGGAGIVPFRGEPPVSAEPLVYQEWIRGISCSALFVRDSGGVRLIGATRQYHGHVGNRFAYRGSLGPWRFEATVEREVAALGAVVGETFDLIGVFGIDLIVAHGRAWLIEVNPRLTASVEVLELALGRSVVAEHLAAFGLELPHADRASPPGPTERFQAKEILFARTNGSIREPIASSAADRIGPEVADIPAVGTRFSPGDPILTVFGSGATMAACQRDLGRALRDWRARVEPRGLAD